MESKKKLIISHQNCPEEILEAIRRKYPDGYHNHVIKITRPNGDPFYAITVDTPTAGYLVKVDVVVDNMTAEEFEKTFGKNTDPEEDADEGGEDKTEDTADNLDGQDD